MPIFQPWSSVEVALLPRSVQRSKYLYRIFDEESASWFDDVAGFLAADRGIEFDVNKDPASARYIVESHAEWSNRDPTPLISATNDRNDAMYLARKRLERRTTVRIAVIDYETVKEISPVYHMMSLAHSLGVDLPRKAQNNSEWVVVGQIPRNAVLEVLNEPSFRAFCQEQERSDECLPVIISEDGCTFLQDLDEYDEWIHGICQSSDL
jgi:hypothetical protein